jgi:hypothetical protein
MNDILRSVWIFILVLCLGCSKPELSSTYSATVPFAGIDPRFVGQEFAWKLNLNSDGTFACVFELPLAVYTEDGKEIIGKGSGQVKGDWIRRGNKLLLTWKSGEGSFGSTNTMSFSFRDDQLKVRVTEEGLVLQERETRLVLKRILD